MAKRRYSWNEIIVSLVIEVFVQPKPKQNENNNSRGERDI